MFEENEMFINMSCFKAPWQGQLFNIRSCLETKFAQHRTRPPRNFQDRGAKIPMIGAEMYPCRPGRTLQVVQKNSGLPRVRARSREKSRPIREERAHWSRNALRLRPEHVSFSFLSSCVTFKTDISGEHYQREHTLPQNRPLLEKGSAFRRHHWLMKRIVRKYFCR